MDKKLLEVLNGEQGNYILPFFWLHGENEEALATELEKIRQSGIREVCVESRPHEGFGGPAWWADMDFIMSKAESLGMRVWLLDDKHFPTGAANGLIRDKYPERRKWHIIEEHVDVTGPMTSAALQVHDREALAENEAELLGAYAYRRINGETWSAEAIKLTGFVRGGFLYWNVPEGSYRIVLLYKTRAGAAPHQRDYIHMIDPASVDTLIEAVYEPHYERYKAYFGGTFAGFFSDEPSFGNGMSRSIGCEPGFYESKLGYPAMALPWRDDLPRLLAEKLGEEAGPLLAGLWFVLGDEVSRIRTAYMDVVTALYRDSFSRKLGEWCRERGVSYIGHIIEDMNAHARLGCSAGHFFRSMDGQDMAGIDVVLHQILPGSADGAHASSCWGEKADPAFFHYMLAKLGASHAHIDPLKKGRAMCEMYGAYGWAEGLPMMKWLTDHMLVRGINHFVPHAFSPKFPDPDCPPHFYAAGHNPQYRDFKVLMDYTNKMSHLLSDGRHVASAAILYHAEAEWSGGRYMLSEVPAKALYDRQIDYDIVPIDAILSDTSVSDGKLHLHQEDYDCLIVPYAACLPYSFLRRASELAAAGLCVLFIDGLPERATGGEEVGPLLATSPFVVCLAAELADEMERRGFAEIRISPHHPLLRAYHYVREETHYFMFFNESLSDTISASISTSCEGPYAQLDLLQGRATRGETRDGAFELVIAPYESALIIFGAGLPEMEQLPAVSDGGDWEELDATYRIELAEATEVPIYTLYREAGTLTNIAGQDENPTFGGWVRYSTFFESDGSFDELDLGIVGETATVTLNGKPLGTRICPPYCFNCREAIRSGENKLEVEVATTLAYRVRDPYSRYLMLPPAGLLGPVRLRMEPSSQ